MHSTGSYSLGNFWDFIVQQRVKEWVLDFIPVENNLWIVIFSKPPQCIMPIIPATLPAA